MGGKSCAHPFDSKERACTTHSRRGSEGERERVMKYTNTRRRTLAGSCPNTHSGSLVCALVFNAFYGAYVHARARTPRRRETTMTSPLKFFRLLARFFPLMPRYGFACICIYMWALNGEVQNLKTL